MTKTKTNTKTYPKTECSKDRTYAIFLKAGFKDIKYNILSSQPVNFLLVNHIRTEQDSRGQPGQTPRLSLGPF